MEKHTDSTKRKCKGTGKAKDNGCGERHTIFRYGLCKGCFAKWLYTTKEGGELLTRCTLKSKKKIEKANRTELKKERESVKTLSEFKKELQSKINKIIRLIDSEKGCISCEHGWDSEFTRQAQAGHRLSVGSHPTLRYMFFNIYKQCSICNNFKSGNERGYDKGIIKFYGEEYLENIKELSLKIKEVHYSKEDIKELIEKANKVLSDIYKGKDYTREELMQYFYGKDYV